MKFLNSTFGFKLFWLAMAFHILNFSIDAPDGLKAGQKEDLTINEMESISEVVLEKLMGFPTALPEHDENDQEEGMEFKLSKYVSPELIYLRKNPILEFGSPSILGVPHNEKFRCQYNPGIEAPPPKLNTTVAS